MIEYLFTANRQSPWKNHRSIPHHKRSGRRTDVPQHVLRFWETRFAQIKPMKRAGGRRYYRPADLDLLKGIRSLLYSEGYTICGLQRILKEEGVAYVSGVGRGEIVARKRDMELDGVPRPGQTQIAPRFRGSAPLPGRAPLARPGGRRGRGPDLWCTSSPTCRRTPLRRHCGTWAMPGNCWIPPPGFEPSSQYKIKAAGLLLFLSGLEKAP